MNGIRFWFSAGSQTLLHREKRGGGRSSEHLSVAIEDFDSVGFDAAGGDVGFAVAVEIGDDESPGTFAGWVRGAGGWGKAAGSVAEKCANRFGGGYDQVGLAITVQVNDFCTPGAVAECEW